MTMAGALREVGLRSSKPMSVESRESKVIILGSQPRRLGARTNSGEWMGHSKSTGALLSALSLPSITSSIIGSATRKVRIPVNDAI